MRVRKALTGSLLWLGSLGLLLIVNGAEDSSDVAGAAQRPLPGLRVYIYPLPEQFQNLSTMASHYDYNTLLYGAEKRIPEMLQEAGYAVKNPAQADFLLVPAYLYAITGQKAMQIKGADMSLQRQANNIVLDHIRTQYPYWNATLGRNHIWILTQDNGFCGFSPFHETHDEIASSVILSHWGLTTPEVPCGLDERLATFNKCPQRQEVEALAALGQEMPLSHPCFSPKKDVVIPSTVWDDLRFVPHESAQADKDRVSDRVRDQVNTIRKGPVTEGRNVAEDPDADNVLASAANPGAALTEPADSTHHAHRHAERHHKHKAMQMGLDVLNRKHQTAEGMSQHAALDLASKPSSKRHADQHHEQRARQMGLDVLTQKHKSAHQHDESAGGAATTVRRRLLAGSAVKTVQAISSVKNHTLFFAGGVLEEMPEYSHGIRQTIFKLFKDEPGFFLKNKVEGIDPLPPEEMFQEMGRSQFCLAPTGFGWGVRLKLAIMLDCIPLVIQDNVQVPFEDVLPYQDFAIRLPPHMIYQLPHVLNHALTNQQRVYHMGRNWLVADQCLDGRCLE